MNMFIYFQQKSLITVKIELLCKLTSQELQDDYRALTKYAYVTSIDCCSKRNQSINE
jgi:hypothetical protein